MNKVLLSLAGLVLLVFGGGAVFVLTKKPDQRPAFTEKIEATPERLARGKYLAEHVTPCMGCHSADWHSDRWGMPPKEGTEGAGGACWDEKMGFSGKLCASNITQDVETGIGGWADGEIARAIREGVSRDGRALFPIMPWPHLRHLADDDVKALVVHLRTIPPVKNAVPLPELDPPLKYIVNFMPQPLEGPVTAPDRSDEVAYGKYLATISGCGSCHTPVDERHAPLPGMELAGGREFKFPWGGSVRSSNLTPHETGLGPRTRENFIAMFRAFASPEARELSVKPEENTVMPWLELAGMSDEDLGAIYAYLRTLPPAANTVEKRTRPSVPAPAEPAEPADPAPEPAEDEEAAPAE